MSHSRGALGFETQGSWSHSRGHRLSRTAGVCSHDRCGTTHARGRAWLNLVKLKIKPRILGLATPQRNEDMSGCQRLVSECLNLLQICHRSVTNLSQAVTDLSRHVTSLSRDMSPRCHELSLASQLRQIAPRRLISSVYKCHSRAGGAGGVRRAVIYSLSRVSPGCHMCHKIVTEMSQDCPAVSRDVADVSPDVTEMSRPSHIFVTRCHKLSQQLSHQSRRVTECQYICRHVNKLTYPRCAGG